MVALVSLALLVGGGIGFTLPHPEPADIADDATVSAPVITVALGMPNTMWDEIAATTPRDGTVTDTWDEYEATWSYDPDTGLDLVIEIIGG